jgi:hypothetical protein
MRGLSRRSVRVGVPALALVLGALGTTAAPATAASGVQRAPSAFSVSPLTAAATGPAGPGFTPLAPTRLLDTRSGVGAPKAALGAATSIDLQVTGRGGVPATGVAAVVLNVTATRPTQPGFLTVFPTGAALPTTSSVNFVAGATVANLVVATVGTGGKVRIYNERGSTQVVGDVTGWYATSAQYTGLTPSRLLDTRNGTGAPKAPLGPKQTLDLQVSGRGGVPASGAVAVALNVTGTGPNGATVISTYPTGSARGTASTLNLTAGQTAAVLVLAKLGTGGKVTLYNNAGSVNLVADVSGWYSADGQFVPAAPYRLADTRTGVGVTQGLVGPGGAVTITATRPGGGSLTGELAAVLSVTGIRPTADTHLTVYPGGTPTPTASSLNLAAGAVVSNAVVVKLNVSGRFTVFNNAGSTHLVVDVLGWVAPSMTITTSALADGHQSVAYSRQLTTSGGEGTARTWSLVAGTVPPGISLSPSGLLSGTPTAVGRFPMTFQAVDETGATATQDQSLAILL